jgi:predicted SAM-dependent methyltransferase
MSTLRVSPAPASRARDAVRHLLARAHLDGAARRCRSTWRRAARTATRHDPTLVARYLAGHPSPRLHLGCGPHLLPGWLNSDFEPVSPAVLRLDATCRFPLPSDTFDCVYSEHMIEHVPRAGGFTMLVEACRVLRPGGRVRITTPDLAFLVGLCQPELSPQQRAYVAWSARTFVRGAGPGDAVAVVNNFVRDWGHQFIYDDATLRDAMARAGFVDIHRRALHDSPDPALQDLENSDRMPPGFLQLESFTLEGVKPLAAPT